MKTKMKLCLILFACGAQGFGSAAVLGVASLARVLEDALDVVLQSQRKAEAFVKHSHIYVLEDRNTRRKNRVEQHRRRDEDNNTISK
jgi:hypothetical protein